MIITHNIVVKSTTVQIVHLIVGVIVIAIHAVIILLALDLSSSELPPIVRPNEFTAVTLLGTVPMEPVATEKKILQVPTEVPIETKKAETKNSTPEKQSSLKNHQKYSEKSHQHKKESVAINRSNEEKESEVINSHSTSQSSKANQVASEANSNIAPTVLAGTFCPRPQYPRASIRNSEQGVVTLRFLIDIEGQVIEAEIQKSSGFQRLDLAARDALSKCRFTPRLVDGWPQKAWSNIRYAWRLE